MGYEIFRGSTGINRRPAGSMADLGVHEFPGRQREIFHIDFAQLDFSLEGRTIYIYIYIISVRSINTRTVGNLEIMKFWKLSSAKWWFQIFFIFTPTWGNDPIWRAYFLDGLKPPTSYVFPVQGWMDDYRWFLSNTVSFKKTSTPSLGVSLSNLTCAYIFHSWVAV